MSVNYASGLSPYVNKGKCGLPEIIDDKEEMIEKAHKLSELIRSSKIVVVHTGAGASTAAGIPDFRGPNGVWTLEGIGEVPTSSIKFDEAVPTFTHLLLVEMEKMGLVQFIVSQNVDGLHLRSGFPRDRLAELHGNMFAQKCHKCQREYILGYVAPTMGLKFTGEKCKVEKKRGLCRGHLQDTILDWDDALPPEELNLSEKFCKSADLSIVIGSSLQIVPASGLPLFTTRNGGKLAIINLQETKQDKHADLRIHGYSDDVMRIVASDLSIRVPEYSAPTLCLSSSLPLPSLRSQERRKHQARKRRFGDPTAPCKVPKKEDEERFQIEIATDDASFIEGLTKFE